MRYRITKDITPLLGYYVERQIVDGVCWYCLDYKLTLRGARRVIRREIEGVPELRVVEMYDGVK